MPLRLLGLTVDSMKLSQDLAFLCDLHKSHLLRVVQSYRPGMLHAGHGGDSEVVIPLVGTSECPTPAHAIFRAETRSTLPKNPQHGYLLTEEQIMPRPY